MRLVMMSLLVCGLTTGACSRTNTGLDQSIGKPDPSSKTTVAAVKEPAWREVTIPAGTPLPIVLDTTVGSDTSSVEQPVEAHLARAVLLDDPDRAAGGLPCERCRDRRDSLGESEGTGAHRDPVRYDRSGGRRRALQHSDVRGQPYRRRHEGKGRARDWCAGGRRRVDWRAPRWQERCAHWHRRGWWRGNGRCVVDLREGNSSAEGRNVDTAAAAASNGQNRRLSPEPGDAVRYCLLCRQTRRRLNRSAALR